MSKSIERKTGTHVDTIEFTMPEIESWVPAIFQRGVKSNAKVQALADELKTNGGVLPGTISFGVLKGKTYLVDGQQRRQSFCLSELPVGYADICTRQFETMADMAAWFVELNSRLVNMKPDDILRGMEFALPALHSIRQRCPFVGYAFIQANGNAPVVSMSLVLRCWARSEADFPGGAHGSSADIADAMSQSDADAICAFLNLAMTAWGRDMQYLRLWGGLNLTLCFWLYRRIVLTVYSAKTQRLTDDLFCKCLMSLSADPSYTDWLVGRHLGEHDRSPAYARIKDLFAKRLMKETGTQHQLPAPAWTHRRTNL